MRNKILSLLVLLLTAATGAWAQGAFSSDPYTSTREFNSVSVTSSMTLNINEGVIVTVNSGLTIEDGVTLTLTGGGRLSVFGKSGNWGRDASYVEGSLIYGATAGEDGKPAITLNGNAKIVIDNGEIYAEGGQGGFGGADEKTGTNQPDGAAGKAFSRFPTIDGATLYYKSSEWIKYTSGDQTLYNKMKAVPPTFEVTINDTKTEASFDMPTYDVDVDYELVRDMSVQMQAQVGDDPAKQPRFRVQWNGKGWVPADLDYKQVMALFSVNDLIEKATLDPENYSVNIYAIDDEGKPTGNAMDFQTFTFAPGRYCVTASANALLGAPYEGTTAPSNIFELIQGYEVAIPAGEYATFYHNEKLRIEDTDAELYTIASVSTTEAVLSEKMEVAPAETPLLVYNVGSETKTFLLIPTDDEASQVLVAAEFRGTLAAKDMPASSSTMDYYVCTGKAFTWVRDAGQIAANRCWLQIGGGNQPAGTRASSRAITRGIGGIDGTTGIDTIDNEQFANDTYYDLNGRKVQNPTRGGIYIHNGKKVIKH